MAKFKSTKADALSNILMFYVLIVGIPLNWAANILYDTFIKEGSVLLKMTILCIAVVWVWGIFYIIRELYIKPFDKRNK